MPPLAAQPHEDTDLDVRKLLSVIWRRRWLVVVFVVLCGAAGVALIEWMVPKYSGLASVRVDESGTATPVVAVLEALSTGGTTEIQTEEAVLAGRTLVEATIDSLALEVQLTAPRHVSRTGVLADLHVTNPVLSGQYAITHDTRGAFHLRDLNADTAFATPVKLGARVDLPGMNFVLTQAALRYSELRIRQQPRSTVVTTMMNSTLVVNQPNTSANVLTVTYTDPDSVLARDVPNTLAVLFIRYRQAAMQAQARNTVTFLRGQLDTLSSRVREAEDALPAFREKEQYYEPTVEGSSQVAYVAKLEGNRAALDVERSALAKVMDDIHAEQAEPRAESAPSPYRKLLGFPTIMATQSAAQLLAALARIENQKADLLMRRKPADPDVQTLDARIHELEQQIENLGQTYLQSLTQQEHAIDSSVASQTAILAKIPAKDIAYARLVRQAQVYEAIDTLLQTKLQESKIAASVDDGSARIVDHAALPSMPVSPNIPIIAAVAVLLGLLLGIAAAFIREFMDRGVHTRDELASITGVPVLGLIPHIESPATAQTRSRRLVLGLRRWHLIPASAARSRTAAALVETRLVTRRDPRNPASEAYRALRTNMTFAEPDRPVKTVVLTSPMPGDGKSTSATNLAITLAQQGLRVLLVDADLRRGTLHSLFAVPRDPGLSNLLIGAATVEAAVHRVDIGLAEGAGGFHVLPTGTLPPNPPELLASARCRALLEQLARDYDAVLFDTPPTNLVTDAVVMGSQADAVMLVARAGSTTSDALAYAMEQLEHVHANVIGTILNDLDFARDARYAGYAGRRKYQQYYYAKPDETL